VPEEEGLGRLAAWTRAVGGWPSIHRIGPLALIGLNSARPTAPLLARGRIGAEQLSRLGRILAAEREAGRMRVILLHHPVADGAVSWRKALADRAALREVLRRECAELVLHGHARDARFDAIEGPQGPIPCLCVPSSSALPNPKDEGARWHRLTLSCTGGSRRARVEVRRWSGAAQAFVPGGGYILCLPRRQATPVAPQYVPHG
ncbi:MAG TPA: metallophosphoesterase, partial [Steroidobacteraceae bacterium]